MKPIDLNITQWQILVEEANRTEGAPHTILSRPLAMRCENTQLSVGWKAGGFTMNDHTYTSFYPRAVNGPCAMLAVREDFLKWVTKRLKEIDELHNEETKQGELGL